MEKVRVELDERSYDIVFGTEQELTAPNPTLLVTDSNVAGLYLEKLKSIVKPVDVVIIPAGEASKNYESWLNICRTAAANHLGRDCRFAAAGGGVVGDLTGFAAASYMRGVSFVQIPTTLLAMVDSSVGGKTGFDIPEGKNLIGAFHQPERVWINSQFLATLDQRELGNGLAEIVKTAVIRDRSFFDFLESNASSLRNPASYGLFDTVIRRCCEIKADVVSHDEKESGLRAILNYGHTFAHPIETLSNYSISHGEAVAIGMRCAGELAVELGMWQKADNLRQSALLDSLGLPQNIPYGINTGDIINLMRNDKKNRNGKITFVVPESIGKVKISSNTDIKTVEAVIRKCSK